MKHPLIIDSEVRVVHPDARKVGYLQQTQEPVRSIIYDHPEAKKAMKLWGGKALLESMDRCGIHYGIVSGLAWNDSVILRENNNYVLDCLNKYPDRLRGLYTPDPLDPDQAADEIMSLDRNKYIGVELIPKMQCIHINDPHLRPIFQAVRQRGLFMKVYTAHPTQTLDGDSPYRTLQFLREYPDIPTLIPHMGGMLCLYGLYPPIREIIKNAYFITSVSATMKMVKFAAEVNPDNLLFGTDFPFNHCFDQETPLNEMKKMELPRDIKEKILGRTAQLLFNLQAN